MSQQDAKGRFVKGNTFGKASKTDPYIQAARGSCKKAMAQTSLIMLKTLKELAEIEKDPETSCLDLLTVDAIRTKNHKYLQFILEHQVGRPNQTQDIEINSNSRNLEGLTQEQLNKLLVLGESAS